MARGSIITRALENGKKRYDTVIRANGIQRWKTFRKKKDAEDYLDRHSTDVRDGTYREIKKAKFGEYMSHYRKTHLIPQKFKPSTYNSYCSIVERHLLPEFKSYPMTAITASEINAFASRLLQGDPQNGKRPVSGRTVRNVLYLLTKFFRKAVTEGYLRMSPMDRVERPRVNKEQKGRALQPIEINSVLERCEGTLRLMVLVAVLTGMRRSEQFALDWDDVDFEKGVIRIRRGLYWQFGKHHRKEPGESAFVFVAPKSEKSIRDIDMSPMLCKELRAHYMRSTTKAGLVLCTSRGTPFNPDNVVKRKFQPAVKRANIGVVRWHDLRHTFGSLKVEQGENIYYVQRQMGHSSIQVTIDIYGHMLESRRPEAAAKTDTLVFGE